MSHAHSRLIKLAPWALLAVSASWGMAFVVMKDPIAKQNVNSFLFTRFACAVIAMIALKPAVLKKITPEILRKGLLAGLFLGTGYIFQTLGLAIAGAAITGFITGLYVVSTPLIAWIVLRQKIDLYTWGCVITATTGLALLSLHGWSVGYGELLVLVSAVAFGAHIVALGHWSNGLDSYAMTVVQLTGCAILTGVLAFAEGYELPAGKSGWPVVIYTAIFCTAIAFMVQTWSQAHISSTKVAVILTMEVVFAALFAVLLGGETIRAQALLGGILVLVAMFAIVKPREVEVGNGN
ncbi:MAG: DMT family transporter [Candidatus Planktophila sp.]